jgi:opacity protein-like surface antigen
MKKHYVVSAILLACATPSLSAGADLGFYVGLEGGQGRTELDLSDSRFVLGRGVLLDASSDREDQTFGLYGGYRFTEHFGIEVAYADLGEVSFSTLRDVPLFFGLTPTSASSGVPLAGGNAIVVTALQQQTTILESEALSMSVVGRYEFATGFSVIGRAGLAIHQIESSLRFSLNGQPIRVIGGEDKTSAGAGLLGLGVEWSFHPNWAVRLQANQHVLLEDEVVIDIDRGDVTTFTAGIEYRF